MELSKAIMYILHKNQEKRFRCCWRLAFTPPLHYKICHILVFVKNMIQSPKPAI